MHTCPVCGGWYGVGHTTAAPCRCSHQAPGTYWQPVSGVCPKHQDEETVVDNCPFCAVAEERERNKAQLDKLEAFALWLKERIKASSKFVDSMTRETEAQFWEGRLEAFEQAFDRLLLRKENES